jgi:exopolysaccharide biosynthesis polyprenyl glycosylphosphotransferase
MQNRAIEGSVRLLDLSCLAIAVPIAYHARDMFPAARSHGDLFPMADYWPFLALTLILWMGLAWIFQVYESYRTKSLGPEIMRIGGAMLAVALVHTSAVFFLKLQGHVSRLFVGLFFVTTFALVAANRVVLRAMARRMRRSGKNLRVFAVVGSGDLAKEVVNSIVARPEWGLQFAGYVLDQEDDSTLSRKLVLGQVSQLGQILDDNVIDEVIFAVPRERLGSVEAAFHLCQEQGAGARICLDLFDHGSASVALGEMDGLPMLSFTRAPRDEIAMAVKRAFDVVTSAAALLALSPVLLLTAAAIKIESPGPIFFRQQRVGRNGRPFRMMKFRSMHTDAETRLEALRHLNEADGPVFKIRNDPRITRVGRFIRRTSIDELPQFLNVLAGEMSVVGPRPPIPAEVRQYQRWQRRRLSVKPGITCTWQVSGRSDISFEKWMQLDLDYIDHWSLWKDLEIVFKTIPAVLLSRGAH